MSHPRFRDFLDKQIEDLLPEYRQRILDYCSRWPAHKGQYALTHYAGHLKEEENKKALYDLINREWMEAKLRCFGSHQPFAADVDIAIQVASLETPLNIVQLIRNCLIFAVLGSLATNVPPVVLGVLARCGQTGTALGHAAMISDSALEG